MLVYLIYRLVYYLNNEVEESNEGGIETTLYNFGIGVLNAVLNFIVATIYEFFVKILVEYENHA